MAEIVTRQTVCDVCAAPAEHYTLKMPEGDFTTDRCVVHAQPLHDFAEQGGKWKKPRAFTRGRVALSTPEEIEQQRNNK